MPKYFLIEKIVLINTNLKGINQHHKIIFEHAMNFFDIFDLWASFGPTKERLKVQRYFWLTS